MHRSAHTPDRNLVTWPLCVLLTREGTVPAPYNRLAGLENPSWPHFPQEILALCLPGRIQAASADLPGVTERGRVPMAGGGGVVTAQVLPILRDTSALAWTIPSGPRPDTVPLREGVSGEMVSHWTHQVRESSWNLPGASGTPSLLKDPVWLLFLNCGRAFAGSQSLTGLGC